MSVKEGRCAIAVPGTFRGAIPSGPSSTNREAEVLVVAALGVVLQVVSHGSAEVGAHDARASQAPKRKSPGLAMAHEVAVLIDGLIISHDDGEHSLSPVAAPAGYVEQVDSVGSTD